MKLKKINIDFEVIEFEDKKTFTIEKDEKKVKIYDEKLIEEVISNKFSERYKRLLYIIMDINNSDDSSDTDVEIIRCQIDELRNSLINKYKNYLSNELLNKYLKMLLILESKIALPEKSRGR